MTARTGGQCRAASPRWSTRSPHSPVHSPRTGVSKDVWVMAEDGADIHGPAPFAVPRLAIRRAAAELPSRVADNLFWFGRYIERLEDSARLTRSVLRRLNRVASSPRDLAELRALARCLAHGGMLDPEAARGSMVESQIAAAVLASTRPGGRVERQLSRLARLTETVRDRLTDDMYATLAHMQRGALADCAAVGDSLDQLGHAMGGVLRFAAAVSGVAAENMVRGGGWLFLDLGRRIERAQEVCSSVAHALEQKVSQIESGLRLCLELCDSAITYRSRYLTVLQPAPVLDLVLADTSNPRALAFQLVGICTRLDDLAGGGPDDLLEKLRGLIHQTMTLVEALGAHPHPEAEATRLPAALRAIEQSVATLSDQINRRYFALLPDTQPLGILEAFEDEEAPARLKGAA